MGETKNDSFSPEQIKMLSGIEKIIKDNLNNFKNEISDSLNNFKNEISESTNSQQTQYEKPRDYWMDREAWRIYDELQRTRMMSWNIIKWGAVAVGRSPRREYDFPLSRPWNVYNWWRRGWKSVNSSDTYR